MMNTDFPEELAYLLPAVEKHGTEARTARFDETLGRHVQYNETLSDEDESSLAELYEQIVARGHASLINAWHIRNWRRNAELAFPLFGLILLFHFLADDGTPPFDKREIPLPE